MDVKIKMIDKKLTKSIINQMQTARLNYLTDCSVLGFVVNIVKNTHKSLIIQHNNNYFIMPMNYRRGEKCVHHYVGKYSYKIDYTNEKEFEALWVTYVQICKEAEQIYI